MDATIDPGGSQPRLSTVWAGVVRSPANGMESVPAFVGPDGGALPLYHTGGIGGGNEAKAVAMLTAIAQQLADRSGLEITICKFTVREDLVTVKPKPAVKFNPRSDQHPAFEERHPDTCQCQKCYFLAQDRAASGDSADE